MTERADWLVRVHILDGAHLDLKVILDERFSAGKALEHAERIAKFGFLDVRDNRRVLYPPHRIDRIEFSRLFLEGER